MIYVDPLWQTILWVAFFGSWVGGTLLLFVRTYLTERTYLHHFTDEYPWLAGEPLFDLPRNADARGIVRILMRERQSDPDLERLRRQMWRRWRYCLLWMSGCPTLTFIGIVLLSVNGVVTTVASAAQQPPSGPQGLTVSRPVVEVLQVVAFVCGLAGSLLFDADAQRGRFRRMVGTAIAMGVLGFLAMLAGTVPKGPVVPLLLFGVGFVVAAVTPLHIKVGTLTANQTRWIGFLLAGLSILIEFVAHAVGGVGITF